jgi:hypothetical protein
VLAKEAQTPSLSKCLILDYLHDVVEGASLAADAKGLCIRLWLKHSEMIDLVTADGLTIFAVFEAA